MTTQQRSSRLLAMIGAAALLLTAGCEDIPGDPPSSPDPSASPTASPDPSTPPSSDPGSPGPSPSPDPSSPTDDDPETPATGDPHAVTSSRSALTDENFYFVMADRFANGDASNDDGGLGDDPTESGHDPARANFYQGGDIQGVIDQLDYIEGLGTTAIWLTPSFTNLAYDEASGSAGYHGYWITDFTTIDPHLGGNDALESLIDAAHERGIKVFFDIITNHTADVIGYEEGNGDSYISKSSQPYLDADGQEFDDADYAGTDDFPALDAATSFPYTPVLEPDEVDLKVPSWLNDMTLYHNRGNSSFTGENSQYGDFYGLDDLFTENPTVVDGMIDIYETWISDFGVDGFRIDTMQHVNDEFWQAFGPQVLQYAHDAGKDEFFMFGEVYSTSRSHTSKYTTQNDMQAVLDFPFQSAARSYVSNGGSAANLARFFEADDWYTDADSNAYSLPTFLGNHDMGRFGAFLLEDRPGAGDDELLARDTLAHELMYLVRGNPVVYYGDEQGFTGTSNDQASRQTMFATSIAQYTDDDLIGTDSTTAQDNYDTSHPLYESISALAQLTKSHPALADGLQQTRYADSGAGVYAFSRMDRDDQVEYIVAVNNATESRTVDVPTWSDGLTFTSLHGHGPNALTATDAGMLTVTVPALSTVVYKAADSIPASEGAPDVAITSASPSQAMETRMHVAADVSGDDFAEVSFWAKSGEDWEYLGTDDNAPFQVYDDVSDLPVGTTVEYQAIVSDASGHESASETVSAVTRGPEPEPEPVDMTGWVTLPGTIDTPLGCSSDWDPTCEDARMTLDEGAGVYTLTGELPAGSYEYKVAIDGAWTVNYGVDGEQDGANIALTVDGDSTVTFTYDPDTHLVTARVS